MHKTWLILKNEFVTTVLRKSFLFSLFGIPIIIAIIFGIIGMLNKNQPGQVEQFFTPAADPLPSGIVDASGLIKSLPEDQNLIAYGDEETARKALEDQKITGFYLIPADYLQSGKLTYVRVDFNPLSAFDQAGTMQDVINLNLLGNDPELAGRYNQPLKVETVNINPKPDQAQESAMGMLVPTGVTVLFYMMLVGASSLLFNSITREKENRVMEILMSSVDAHQILTGKIIALGLVGLLQLGVWLGSGILVMGAGQQMQIVSGGFSLPGSLLGWALLYFLGGYMLYASLMAGVGAMVPNLREGSQMTSLILMPMIVPLVLMSNIIQDPDGTIAVVLSLFPFTSSVSMLARMASSDVPLWQAILAAVLLIGGSIWVVRMVAAMFRSQVILAGQPFSRKRFFKVLLGKLD